MMAAVRQTRGVRALIDHPGLRADVPYAYIGDLRNGEAVQSPRTQKWNPMWPT
jgi:hypothetical protein